MRGGLCPTSGVPKEKGANEKAAACTRRALSGITTQQGLVCSVVRVPQGGPLPASASAKRIPFWRARLAQFPDWPASCECPMTVLSAQTCPKTEELVKNVPHQARVRPQCPLGVVLEGCKPCGAIRGSPLGRGGLERCTGLVLFPRTACRSSCGPRNQPKACKTVNLAQSTQD
jgi:hypothetical protein